jgi:hypothetical protein
MARLIYETDVPGARTHALSVPRRFTKQNLNQVIGACCARTSAVAPICPWLPCPGLVDRAVQHGGGPANELVGDLRVLRDHGGIIGEQHIFQRPRGQVVRRTAPPRLWSVWTAGRGPQIQPQPVFRMRSRVIHDRHEPFDWQATIGRPVSGGRRVRCGALCFSSECGVRHRVDLCRMRCGTRPVGLCVRSTVWS